MSESQEQPWSDNPNAPQISHELYFAEKTYFAGILLASILYGAYDKSHPHIRYPCLIRLVLPGILIVLFFQCMTALFSPVNRRREGIRWWLVSYTVLMFSIATVLTGTALYTQSICYIDNREYPGIEGILYPGPLGYRFLVRTEALGLTSSLAFLLNYWLADGFLVGSLFDVMITRPSI